MSESGKSFGKRVKSLREGRGYSLRELGKKLGVSASHISRVERGLAPPSPKLVRLLAEEFEAPDLFVLAGRKVPSDFFREREEDREGGTGGGKTALREFLERHKRGDSEREIRERYPDKDPFLAYGRDFPDLEDFGEEAPFFYDIGLRPEEAHLFPPLRKRVIDLLVQAQSIKEEGIDLEIGYQLWREKAKEDDQWPKWAEGFENFEKLLESFGRYNRVIGRKEGIKEALEVLKQTQKEKGDYCLLAAFYEPETARALAGFLEFLRSFKGEPHDRDEHER